MIFLFTKRGVKKNTAIYPHFVDEAGGSLNVDKRWEGGGASHGDKKIPYCNCNCQNVDKPRGGVGLTSRIYVCYRHKLRVTEGL